MGGWGWGHGAWAIKCDQVRASGGKWDLGRPSVRGVRGVPGVPAEPVVPGVPGVLLNLVSL